MQLQVGKRRELACSEGVLSAFDRRQNDGSHPAWSAELWRLRGTVAALPPILRKDAMASSVDTRNLSVYVLGAGFSAPAGFPLGTALWREIYGRAMIMAADRSQRASKFRDDLQAFIEFKQQCHGTRLQPEEVSFEEFLGFLDIEHFLGLRGSETWSEAGNESQVIVKTLIGQVLSEYLPRQVPALYLEFARKLKPRT